MNANAIGRTLGSYRVVETLGEGGMGVVYLAEHPLLGSRAAVKQLHPQLTTERGVVERFFDETRAAARIKHTGIASVFDFGFAEDGSAYVAREHLDGESLGERLRREGRIPEEDVIALARQIAGALAAAHEAGIVHRDLKPDNVFLVAEPAAPGGACVKLLDFGIAHLGGESRGADGTPGPLLGDPRYLSPEQCHGEDAVDARIDVYALGCVLYEMLCGRPPFTGDSAGEIRAGHLCDPPEPLRSLADVSLAMESLVLRALAKRPAERQPSMRVLLGELDMVEARRRRPSMQPAAPSGTWGVLPREPPAPGRERRRGAWPTIAGILLAGVGVGLAAALITQEASGRQPADRADDRAESSWSQAPSAPLPADGEIAPVVEREPTQAGASRPGPRPPTRSYQISHKSRQNPQVPAAPASTHGNSGR